jgi:hypothetical protein
MTVQEYNQRLGKVIEDIQHNEEVMVKLGASALTFIKKRVQETGTDAKGQKYKPYSTKATLVGCKTFIQKSACQALLGSKKKRKELQWRKIGIGGPEMRSLAILPGGYKKIRELQGRQTAFVDFSMTNSMWNDINIISKSSDHQKGIVIIGAKQDIEKKKLAGNTKRRGDILDLNPVEIEDLYQTYKLKTLQIFRNNGL